MATKDDFDDLALSADFSEWLNSSHEQEHQNNDHDNAEDAGWSVSPSATVSPRRECTYQNEDKDY